eukprot:2183875-Amphidinium_carterae.3
MTTTALWIASVADAQHRLALAAKKITESVASWPTKKLHGFKLSESQLLLNYYREPFDASVLYIDESWHIHGHVPVVHVVHGENGVS